MTPDPNWRYEAVVSELARLIEGEHHWDCDHEERGSFCGPDVARAVLAYLHGAGLIHWGAGINPMPPAPDGTDPYALRLGAEFWHVAAEPTADEVETGARVYHWLPGVLAVRAGYRSSAVEPVTRTFLDALTGEQRGHLVPMLRAVLAELDPPTTTAEKLSMTELYELCDNVRARLMYNRSRGVSTYDEGAWMCLGWDVGHREGVGLRHPSEAVSKIFYAPVWRPTLDELTWFRLGFAHQREGSPRPTMRG
jgi:hypothetical protein